MGLGMLGTVIGFLQALGVIGGIDRRLRAMQLGTALAIAFAAVAAACAHTTDPLTDVRYCGAPARYADGRIVRSAAVRAAFQRLHPCPSTGLTSGSCPGWAADHVWPLATCGCDHVSNLQWLPNEIKSGAGTLPKDRWERTVYSCSPPPPSAAE